MSLANFFKAFLAVYFLVGMHIILETPGGTGLYLSFNIIAWLCVVILIALGLWKITVNNKIYYSKMLIGLALGCFCLVVPVFYNFEFTDHAIPRLLALIGGLLLLFSLYQFKFSVREQSQLLWLMLIAVAIETSLGLAQFFIFEEGFWGGYKLGISRPHGVFLQPNVMASFIATGIAIALFLSASCNKQQHKNSSWLVFWLQKPLIYLVLFFGAFLLLVLQSRTGHLGILLSLTLIAPYLYKKDRKQLAVNLLIISLGISLGLTNFNNSDLPKRDTSIYQSVGARGAIFEVSTDMIITKPLVGYGYGNFERSFIDHFNHYAITTPEIGNTIERLSHPHNEVLFWVVEGGSIALLGFLIFAFVYINIWLKIPLRKALALFALILPILLHSQLEFPFYSAASHFIIFLLLLWFTDTCYQHNQADEILSVNCQKTFLIRFLAILVPMIFIPFLITSLHTAHILVEHEKSQFRSVEKLKSIINPMAWRSRFDAAIYAHIFVSALAEHDVNKLERYITWGLARVKHKPRVNIYENMLLAMTILNKQKSYQRLLTEAKHTYPQHHNWEANMLTSSKKK